MRRLIAAAILLAGLALVQPLHAAVVTDPDALDPDAVITDFESIAAGTMLPLYDGFMLIESSNNPFVGVRESGGNWVQIPGVVEGHLVGHEAVDYFIEFDQPVSQFGMGIFDPNFAGNVLRALDSDGSTLEEVISGTAEFPVGPTQGVFATYVGFVRPTNDIRRIELIHVYSYEQAIGDHLSIDNVTYYITPGGSDGGNNVVPEASSLVVWSVLTIAGIGYARSRKRRGN